MKSTYFASVHNCPNTLNLHHYWLFADYAIQNQQFSIQIENQQHNLMILGCRVSEYLLNANSAFPDLRKVTFSATILMAAFQKISRKEFSHKKLTRTMSCIKEILNIQSNLI